MVAMAEGSAMAKAKGRPKKPGGEGTQVRIEPDLASKAKYLATQQGMSLSEYLSDAIRPRVEKDFLQVGRELFGEAEKGPKSRGAK